jgi:glycosyltransferase involved in cell wall biosynthesis
MAALIPHITVCICTFKRPELLGQILDAIARQETHNQFTYSIVVSDNDCAESARSTVETFKARSGMEVVYAVEPEQNIALARNRALANAHGEYVALIDDDEFPVSDWLLKLLIACRNHQSAGVLAPVRPRFETAQPKWFVKGRFYCRPEHETGTVMHWTDTRTGNVLLRRGILAGLAEPFRRQFGSGSEDTDFFQRMQAAGHVFTWCNEAPVYELVPADRCTRKYMLRRALLRGQSKRHTATFAGVARSCVAAAAYSFALPIFLLVGQHLFIRHLISWCDHVGKLIGVLGFTPMGDKYLTPAAAGSAPRSTSFTLDSSKA